LKYITGIDSGATSSEVVLFPLSSGQVITKKYPSVNISVLGIDEAAKRLTSIVKDISKIAGKGNISAITAGISGARYETDRKKLELSVRKAAGIKNVMVLPDTEIAFASAFEPNETNCGILIAGTGSILYYRDKAGKLVKIGGWGRHIGDEGSGYWIAREALYKVTKHYDGRQKETSLAKVLEKEFGINKENIVKHVYHNGFEISQLTKHVFRCAEKGDSVSREIIRSASENLLSHFIPLKGKKYRIALMGSLFSEERLLEKYLRKLAKEKFSRIELIKPAHKPVWGAVKIASQL
jgi:glucosamine kinase